MSASSDLGFEIHLATPDETVLCVDTLGVVRSMYLAPYTQYFSPYENWCDTRGIGKVDKTRTRALTAHDLDGKVLLSLEGVPLWNIPVVGIRYTHIPTAVALPIITGIHELAHRPGTFPDPGANPLAQQ